LRSFLRWSFETRELAFRKPATIVVPSARRTHHDLIAMLERLLAIDAFSVDVRSVQTAKIAKPKAVFALLNHAVLFGHDPVQQLDGVVRVTPDRIRRAKLCSSLAFR
jgi:hypothetical protein